MDKETEIKTLQSLKGDTYFAQYFSNKDIDQMCSNIKDDIGIESYCSFNEEAASLRRSITDLRKEIQIKIHDWGMEFIKAIEGGFDDDLVYQIVEDELGIEAIIKFKRKEHLELTEKEIDYLVSKI